MSTTTDSLACLFFIGALLHVVVAVDHHVGGDFGWNLPPTPTFFSEWAHNRTFFVGDKLIFKSRANETHTIAEPTSQADFDGCVNPGIVFDSIIFISFDSLGRLYYISTAGNDCNVGMKFSINVLPAPGTVPNAAVKVGAVPVLLFVTIIANLFFFL